MNLTLNEAKGRKKKWLVGNTLRFIFSHQTRVFLFHGPFCHPPTNAYPTSSKPLNSCRKKNTTFRAVFGGNVII